MYIADRLRTLSHGGASGSKSGSQGLAPSASRRPKPASLNYSRDEMLTVYESCTGSSVPDGLLALPDIAVEKSQPPLASIPPSAEEQVTARSHSIPHSTTELFFPIPDMTCNVFGGTLSLTQSISQSIKNCLF